MSTAAESPPPTFETIADLLAHLGDVPAYRVRLRPTPGTATIQDAVDLRAREKCLLELVDGVLVEKGMGFLEAFLAAELAYHLATWVRLHDSGIILGADATIRLLGDQVRIPDVSYFAWDHFPGRQLPPEPIPDIAPDLAVEVLSKSNTRREMARKPREYFEAGARLVWYVDPKTQTVTVYTTPDRPDVLWIDDTLDGGNVLSGFALPLRDLFATTSPPQAGCRTGDLQPADESFKIGEG
ncbi:MAG TPA: Uma2 family endonuclease [Isosphaeraceae bacterium]|jgi:Uma2 family endonuclease|nr:Uma2 family endonuclease [Isosphaeraceae bacterium]